MDIRDIELMRKLNRQYYFELKTNQNKRKGYVLIRVQVLLVYRLLSLLALTLLMLMFLFPHQ